MTIIFINSFRAIIYLPNFELSDGSFRSIAVSMSLFLPMKNIEGFLLESGSDDPVER
jgi:hypothetical protein